MGMGEMKNTLNQHICWVFPRIFLIMGPLVHRNKKARSTDLEVKVENWGSKG